jgi:hypothetical protein
MRNEKERLEATIKNGLMLGLNLLLYAEAIACITSSVHHKSLPFYLMRSSILSQVLTGLSLTLSISLSLSHTHTHTRKAVARSLPFYLMQFLFFVSGVDRPYDVIYTCICIYIYTYIYIYIYTYTYIFIQGGSQVCETQF